MGKPPVRAVGEFQRDPVPGRQPLDAWLKAHAVFMTAVGAAVLGAGDGWDFARDVLPCPPVLAGTTIGGMRM